MKKNQEMINLQDALHAIGMPHQMIRMLSESVAHTQIAEGRWTESDFDKKYYDHRDREYPPTIPRVDLDVDDAMRCELTAAMMNLKMSRGEMVIFYQHIKSIQAFLEQIERLCKKPALH